MVVGGFACDGSLPCCAVPPLPCHMLRLRCRYRTAPFVLQTPEATGQFSSASSSTAFNPTHHVNTPSASAWPISHRRLPIDKYPEKIPYNCSDIRELWRLVWQKNICFGREPRGVFPSRELHESTLCPSTSSQEPSIRVSVSETFKVCSIFNYKSFQVDMRML